MNSYSKLSYAIAAILGGSVAGLAHAATATDTAPISSDSIQEITVTAQRRTENIQDVPIAFRGKFKVGAMFENGYMTGIYEMDAERAGEIKE